MNLGSVGALAGCERVAQVLRGLRTHALKSGERFDIQCIKIGGSRDLSALHEFDRLSSPPALRCPLPNAMRSASRLPCAAPDKRPAPDYSAPPPPAWRHRWLGSPAGLADSRCTIGLPQEGHAAGKSTVGAPSARRPTITETTCGMTSPARRTNTASPTRRSRRRTSSMLCKVALLTVTPPTNTGSSLATGVMAHGSAQPENRPPAPGWWLPRPGILYATAQRGLARYRTQALLLIERIDLDDGAPSMS